MPIAKLAAFLDMVSLKTFRGVGTHTKRGHLINNVKDLVKPQTPLFFNLVLCKDMSYEELASRPVTSHGCDRNWQS